MTDHIHAVAKRFRTSSGEWLEVTCPRCEMRHVYHGASLEDRRPHCLPRKSKTRFVLASPETASKKIDAKPLRQ